MNKLELINKINSKLQEFGVDDCIIKKEAPALILNIEKEDNMPNYKIAVSINDNEQIYIYTAFAHDIVLSKDIKRLLPVLNEFNNESFLKFTINKKYVKISYTIPEFMDDIEYVVRVLTIIPNLIHEFYQDLVEKVNKIRG